MDTIRTKITEESREVEILEGDRQIEITEKTLEVIEETAVVEAETADAVAAAEAEVATEEAEAADEADSEEEAGEKFEESATAESEKDNTEETVSDGKKVRVIGVRFRTAGKVYYFDPGEWKVVHGGHVIVETVRGIEYGTVVGLPMEIDAR